MSETDEARRDQEMRGRYANRLRMWATLLEALAVKLDYPAPHHTYQNYDSIMENLSKNMQTVIRFFAW
jgi:transposase-like protein